MFFKFDLRSSTFLYASFLHKKYEKLCLLFNSVLDFEIEMAFSVDTDVLTHFWCDPGIVSMKSFFAQIYDYFLTALYVHA